MKSIDVIWFCNPFQLLTLLFIKQVQKRAEYLQKTHFNFMQINPKLLKICKFWHLFIMLMTYAGKMNTFVAEKNKLSNDQMSKWTK